MNDVLNDVGRWLVDNPIAQGVIGIAIAALVKKLLTHPPDSPEFRSVGRADAAIGPDLLLVALLAAAGKWARLSLQLDDDDLRRSATSEYMASVESLQTTAVLIAAACALVLAIIMALVPAHGWHPPAKVRRGHYSPRAMRGWAIVLPLVAGVMLLLAALNLITTEPAG